jgi:hypothetical protein
MGRVELRATLIGSSLVLTEHPTTRRMFWSGWVQGAIGEHGWASQPWHLVWRRGIRATMKRENESSGRSDSTAA